MTTTTEDRLYSADEFLHLPDADRFELLHGKLVERNVGMKADWIAARVLFLIELFLQQRPLGFALGAQATYACFPDDPRHAPRPDVSFVRFGRFSNDQLPEGYSRIRPDLVVEVVSPNDSADELSEKIADFQSVGVPLIWVVYPSTRRVLIHRLATDPAGRVSELAESDTLSGESVLPGFSCPVAEIFQVPTPPAESERR